MYEPNSQFEGRKRDHIAFALKRENEARGGSGLDRVSLQHEALPDLNLSEIEIKARSLDEVVATPFLVSSMTAGHASSLEINRTIAVLCEKHGWWMGVGSQRRELHDRSARDEWRKIRKAAPSAALLGNLGIAQVIETEVDLIADLVENLEAKAMIVHLNALQECLQPEGTPHFAGGLTKIAALVKKLTVPVVVKETGCGISAATARRLIESGVRAIDVGGYGGTHWGRIEGARAPAASVHHEAALAFADWGIATVDSVREVISVSATNMSAANNGTAVEVWASGGVRSGLDAAKLLALGAAKVGFAKPILEAAIQGESALDHRMDVIEYELKTAMFCTGSRNVEDLRGKAK